MKKRIRVGIIGTGFGARMHAPLMKHHEGFEVVAIASVYRGNHSEIEQSTGIKNIYTNWQQMLQQEELDLVSVVSNPLHHHEMVLKSFEHGSHVLCEKPMAMEATQSEEMIDAKNRANRKGFINHEFRFLPARLKVKEIIDSGKLGKLLHINYQNYALGTRSVRKMGWLGQKESGGGLLGAIGSHMIDSMLWWKATDISSVYGQLTTHFPTWSNELGEVEHRTADDAFSILGTFVDGTTFNTELFYGCKHLSHRWKLAVYGTEGTLVMTDDLKVELGYGDEPLTEVELPASRPVPQMIPETARFFYPPFMQYLDNLYRAIMHDDQAVMLPTFEDGLRVQKVLDAVRQSSEEGRKINVN